MMAVTADMRGPCQAEAPHGEEAAGPGFMAVGQHQWDPILG